MLSITITEKWNAYLEWFDEKSKDIYYEEEYVKLYERDGIKALCIIGCEGSNIVIFPFLRGEIDGHYDMETPYGYGGPISNSNDSRWVNDTLKSIWDYLRREGYICSFIRFHPLLSNERLFLQTGEFGPDIIYDRQTVSIDLSKGEQDIWNDQMKPTCRNKVRKAQKCGLYYRSDFDMSDIHDFISLYIDTMKRLNAEPFYFFSEEYFVRLVKSLKGSVFVGRIEKDERLVCASLFMYKGSYGHYHLSGSNEDYLRLGANNLLLWGAACELRRLGITEFHLGGGYDGSDNNSLLAFKRSFSDNTHSFYIGKSIFDSEMYSTICSKWRERNPLKKELYEDRLLMYRY